MTTTTDMKYRNLNTLEEGWAHRIGTDEQGRALFYVPEGCEPTEPYELDEDGLAYLS